MATRNTSNFNRLENYPKVQKSKRHVIFGDLQVPNFIVDLVMPRIAASHFKVLLFILRKTTGCHKRSEDISLSDTQRGCGVSRSTAVAAIKLFKDCHLIRRLNGTSRAGKACYEVAYPFETDYVLRRLAELVERADQSNLPSLKMKSVSVGRILRADRTAKIARNAELRYTAGARTNDKR